MNNSFDKIAERLNTEFSGVKLIALGQTVYWDEPMKAVLRRRLDESCPDAVMMVGIHDADYFSKVPQALGLNESWAILTHDDGPGRDLWVAAGEISRLFGSETIPSKELFTKYGVQFDKIGRSFPGGRDALVAIATEAWGWRGLARVNSGNDIACCIELKDALPHFVEILRWGFDRTIDSLADPVAADNARVQGDELIHELTSFAEKTPDAFLPEAFCHVLERFYTRLLGAEPRNLELTKASDVFRFDRSTASQPRFRLLGAFLNPETRAKCQSAYDLAVEGSDTYALDKFPEGAIPFDLVVPCEGRGTICLRDGTVVIDLDEPVTIKVARPPGTVEELAGLIEDHFGSNCALIGKALTLVLMMSSEFIFVLHEQASGYVPRTEKMATLMEEQGVFLPFYPILRIDYHTWDAFSACDASLMLPGTLASVFGQGEITSKEFSESWAGVCAEQEKLLDRLEGLSGFDDLLSLLAERQGGPWPARIDEYRAADRLIRDLSSVTEPLKAESMRLRDLSYSIKQEIQEMEQRKGDHFRSKVKPLMDELSGLESDEDDPVAKVTELRSQLREAEEERSRITAEIDTKRAKAANAAKTSQEIKAKVEAMERSPEAESARRKMKTTQYEAELARLWMVRDAILTTKGLSYTDHRPSAWWFMLVDPELKWFNRVLETAEYRFEGVGSE
jgi:predicted  nucleic acid-binding Zn-ribbon protein